MQLFIKWRAELLTNLGLLNVLHIFNDGYQASFLLLLPFIAKDLNFTLTQVGVLGTVVNSLSIVLALPSGYLAAKYGGFRTIIIAAIIYGLGFLGAGISPLYATFIVVFLTGGIGYGVFHPISFALIARWSPKETRGRAMGNFTAIGDIGRIGIAALLTFIVVYTGWRVASVIYGIVVIIIALFLYRIVIADNTPGEVKKQHKSKVTLWEIVKHKQFLFASATDAIDSFASDSLYVFLPFLLLSRGINPGLLGSFTGAFFIGNYVGKSYLGRFVDKLGNTRVFMLSDILMALFIVILANSSQFLIIITSAIILGIFTKGTIPITQTMVSESAEHHEEFEKVFAIGALITKTATTAAPVFFGIISDVYGIVNAFNVMALIAVFAVLPAFAFHFSKQK